MLSPSKVLLLSCFVSLSLACSTSPVPKIAGGAGAGGGSAGASADGSQADDDSGVAGGGGTNVEVDAEVDGAVDDRSLGEDGHAEDGPADDAQVDGARLDASKADAPKADAPKTDAGRDVASDRPATKLADGSQCTGSSVCRSGFCVDGVCCASACNNGCSACVMVKTGKADGTCAADKGLDKTQCGTACSTLAMGVAGVIQKVCDGGNCVASPLLKIVDICQVDDKCTTSFCDQPDPNTARCVNTVCPQQGTCCCGAQDGTRMCAQTTACKGDRSCM